MDVETYTLLSPNSVELELFEARAARHMHYARQHAGPAGGNLTFPSYGLIMYAVGIGTGSYDLYCIENVKEQNLVISLAIKDEFF